MMASDASATAALLPPHGRDATSLELTVCALEGAFRLQFDTGTGRVQYPPREIAAFSLSEDLEWRDVEPRGTVLAATVLRASGSAYTRELLPWPIVLMEVAGARIIAHALEAEGAFEPGDRVRLELRLDRAGRGVYCAFAAEPGADADAAVDTDTERRRAEFLATARGSRLRIVGEAQAERLVAAATAGGAEEIFVDPLLFERLAPGLRERCIPDTGAGAGTETSAETSTETSTDERDYASEARPEPWPVRADF